MSRDLVDILGDGEIDWAASDHHSHQLATSQHGAGCDQVRAVSMVPHSGAVRALQGIFHGRVMCEIVVERPQSPHIRKHSTLGVQQDEERRLGILKDLLGRLKGSGLIEFLDSERRPQIRGPRNRPSLASQELKAKG